MSRETSETFIAALQKSRLLTDEQFGLLPDTDRNGASLSALTRELTDLDWLTPWQINQLRSGHTNFRLGKYILLDVLGRGKMGVVYKARRTGSRQLVAVKVMASGIADDRRKSARFRREIRLVSALKDPHIVSALDAGHAGGRYFLVTELIPGWNLLQWLERERVLPVGWVCECLRQASIGLQHIHERELIHRDMKPSNLMVTADSVHEAPHVRILDLGLGRFVGATVEGDDLTCAGHTVGTLDYMAPEQIKSGRDADIRADIYSLGCTAYQSLSGRLPFEGADVGSKLIAKMTTEPPALDALRNDVPHDLADLVARMMRREREQRPSSPQEVCKALQPFAKLGILEECLSPSSPSIASDFFDSVESMHECHLTRRQRTQPEGLAQKIAAWFKRAHTTWRFGRAPR